MRGLILSMAGMKNIKMEWHRDENQAEILVCGQKIGDKDVGSSLVSGACDSTSLSFGL